MIDRLIERNAVGARGNHDEWLIAWAAGRGFDRAAFALGGEATLTSYGSVGRDVAEVEAEAKLVPRTHLAWLESLALAIDLHVDGHAFWVIHAGVPADVVADQPSTEVVARLVAERPLELLWSFTDPALMPRLDRPVIFGHRCHDRAIDLGHAIAVDTGCGTRPTGYLTAVLLSERRFVDSR